MALEFLKEKRKDLYYVDIRLVDVIEGFNVREDYGDIVELSESIKENGVKVPARGYRNGERWVLVDGHRRRDACLLLLEQGIVMEIPMINEGQKVSDEQRIIDMFILNDGKKLTMLEESEAIGRLIKYNIEPKEIAKKIGRSVVYVSNMKLLSSCPENIKESIRTEKISPTLAIDLMRKNDFSEVEEIIEEAIEKKRNESGFDSTDVQQELTAKNERITAKDIAEIGDKYNSLNALKVIMKEHKRDDYEIKKGQELIVNFLENIFEGNFSRSDILNELFIVSDDDYIDDGKDIDENPQGELFEERE